jgi:hypothetical protein
LQRLLALAALPSIERELGVDLVDDRRRLRDLRA